MRFLEIRTRNFRNFETLSAAFPEGAQFICGRNGQGKTNLLEALSLVTSLRSFRTAEIPTMIRRDAMPREAVLVFSIRHEQLGDTMLEIRLGQGAKHVLLDGNPVRKLGEILGLFPTISFSSQDIQILRGAPNLRRRLLDMMFILMDPGYFDCLSRYHQALKSRNALLKQGADPARRRTFEEYLVREGWQLCRLRRELLDVFLPHFRSAYAGISGVEEQPDLRYLASIEAGDPDSYEAVFHAGQRRDRETMTTNRGPHRDDLGISLQGHQARDFGSEGQQRGLVLSLRMGLVSWYHKRGGTPPVILADDIVGELDPERRKGFWRMLGGDCQIVATGTRFPSEDDFHDWVHWHMDSGQLSRDGEQAAE
jgi:DNA replication and repair protein RecF